VTLAIGDDGQGFEAGAPSAGLGLRSMRERVEALGGRFSLESAPGRGTQVRASLRDGPAA
jgi:signal transduction histidine kinase